MEARLAAYSAALKQAENARVQIRRQHQASVKRGKYSKHSIAYEEVGARFLEKINKYKMIPVSCTSCKTAILPKWIPFWLGSRRAQVRVERLQLQYPDFGIVCVS